MKVLYISKALIVAAYRSKLDDLRTAASVTAVVPRRWKGQQVERNGGTTQIELANALFHGHNHFHVYPQLKAILDAVRPDIVHIDEEPYSLVTLQASRLCKQRGIPSLFFAWQNLNKRLPPPFGRVRRAVFESVSGGIAGTASAARVLRTAGFAGPVSVVPQFGVNPDIFQAREKRSAGPLTVGFGGRLVHEKGVDLLLRAAAQLPDITVSIAGEGPARSLLTKLAGELGISGRVNFLGHVPSLDIPSWLHTVDVLALPSRATPAWAEQFGRIMVEAMACAIPVVASRTGEIPDVLQDGGLLIAQDDAAGLRNALADLAENSDLRGRLGAAGRQRVLQNYTNQRVASDSLAFYQQIVAGAS